MKTMLMLLVVATSMWACGSDDGGTNKSCASLCTEAQAGKCTSIKGACGAFCTSMETLAGPANCASQKTAYQSCLGKGAKVCDSVCSAQEKAVTDCYTAYCAKYLTDKDCQTLAASFL